MGLQHAGVAQLAEQRFRKPQAGGAIPLASFLFFFVSGACFSPGLHAIL